MINDMIYDYYLSKAVENKKYTDIELGENKKEIREKIKKDKDVNIFYPKSDDLPENAILIKITFTLKKPYTSKDEGEFYIIGDRLFENPIVRDKFTGLPMVKPSTWKGHLRFAADKVEWAEKEKKEIIKKLFGSEPEEKESPSKGCLYFFPTFFIENAKKEVITPLKRDTRTPAKGPINLEVIEPGREGEFYLLYFPYPKDEIKEENIKNDLGFLGRALALMFYTYGFSAKKTSGFGVVEQLKEDEVEIYPEKRKDSFSILYTRVNKNNNHSA